MSETITTAQINSAATQDLQNAITGTGANETIVTGTTDSSAITAISSLTVKSVGSAMNESLADSTFSTVGSSAGTPASPGGGSTAVDAGSGQGSGFIASDSSSNGSTLVSGEQSPISQAAMTQMSSSGTPPSGGASADASSSATPSPQSTTLAAAPADNESSTDTGTLGARGPPTTYGPVLILAAIGGSISAGDSSLTFAPGSQPHDALVSVTVTTVAVDGLQALSPAYDLKAVDPVTGETFEQFNSPPEITISGSSPGSIYYLDPVNGLEGTPSLYDSESGTVSADLPHFSADVLASGTWTVTRDSGANHTATHDESSGNFTSTDAPSPWARS